MTHQKIIELFTRYEKDHPIETYRCYDWNVWPLLRISTSYEAVLQSGRLFRFGEKRFKELLKQSRLIWRFEKLANAILTQLHRKKILGIDSDNSQNPTQPGRNVVILTHSERRHQMGSCLYEIYADPLVEYLAQLGISTLTWERGKERWPRCLPSAWISRLLATELLKMAQPAPLIKPIWFADFELFTSSLLGRRVSWAETEAKIQIVQQNSMIFEKWLKATGAKLLISVCWYDPEIMAATLASRRLGVISCDQQHGLQGSSHPNYSGWENTPSGGYETVPDIFMSWGNQSATLTLADNPAFSAQSKTVVTGNLWFNKCRKSSVEDSNSALKNLKSKIKIHSKIILITLQSGFGCEKFIIETMQRAPENWFWLVRFHPTTSVHERSAIEKKLSKVPRSRFEAVLPSTLPLYPLLLLAQIHLTGHSTTALEALGFGVPTITLTDNGAKVFQSYIAKGVMQQASSAEELLHKIRLCENTSTEKCHREAEKIFASVKNAADGIDRLLSIAGIKKGI